VSKGRLENPERPGRRAPQESQARRDHKERSALLGSKVQWDHRGDQEPLVRGEPKEKLGRKDLPAHRASRAHRVSKGRLENPERPGRRESQVSRGGKDSLGLSGL